MRGVNVGYELRCILDWKKNLLQVFEDKNYNKLVDMLMEEEEVKQVEKFLSMSKASSPFLSLYTNGKQQVKELKESRISITMFGRRGVGNINTMHLV